MNDDIKGQEDLSNQMWFWWGFLGLVMLGLYAFSGILTPFIVGFAVAYFLDPLADRLEVVLKSRSAATAVILLTFFSVIGGVVMALLPLLQVQITGLVAAIPDGVEVMRGYLEPIIIQLHDQIGSGQMQSLTESASAYTGEALLWLGKVVQSIFLGGKAFINALSLLFIMPVVAFFLLRDWDVLVAKVDEFLPRVSAPTIREQFHEIDATIAGFVRGQAMVCLVLGTLYATGLTLVGLDFGLLIGLGTGLMAFVPYVGMIIGLVVAFSVAVIQFSDVGSVLMVASVFALGQTLDAAYLTPNLVGGRVGLHPVWIIFALMAGASLFGFVGVLVAVPGASVVGVLVRFALSRYRQSHLYSGT